MFDDRQGLPSIGSQGRNGPQQALGIGVGGSGEQLCARPGFDYQSRAHYGDTARHLPHHREIVGDEQHGQPMLPLQICEEGENLRLDRDVQRGRGLVGNQKSRPVDECHRNEDALPLSP